jgi:hypothetical protein
VSDRDLTRPPTDARLQHLAASISRVDRTVERERQLAQAQHHQGQPHMAARRFLPVMTLAEARESGAFRELVLHFETEGPLPAGAQAYLVADGHRVALLTDLDG